MIGNTFIQVSDVKWSKLMFTCYTNLCDPNFNHQSYNFIANLQALTVHLLVIAKFIGYESLMTSRFNTLPREKIIFLPSGVSSQICSLLFFVIELLLHLSLFFGHRCCNSLASNDLHIIQCYFLWYFPFRKKKKKTLRSAILLSENST